MYRANTVLLLKCLSISIFFSASAFAMHLPYSVNLALRARGNFERSHADHKAPLRRKTRLQQLKLEREILDLRDLVEADPVLHSFLSSEQNLRDLQHWIQTEELSIADLVPGRVHSAIIAPWGDQPLSAYVFQKQDGTWWVESRGQLLATHLWAYANQTFYLSEGVLLPGEKTLTPY